MNTHLAPPTNGKNGGVAVRLEAVDKVYRTEKIETVALSHVNLQIAAGEFLAVMGPSGSGKSTLLNVLGLLDAPSAGQVIFDDAAVSDASDRQLATLRNREIGFIFQSFHLIADLNALDNVQIPLLYRGLSHRERRARAERALERVGLKARMHHYPTQLSGGQQQRVAIARAIVGSPRLLLADEPTGNLDSKMGEDVMQILEEYNGESGVTVVMVTHDQRLADRTQRTVRLFDGRQVQ
ncbi:MAG: ABC transporter ATP-binding protein [Acidobacteriota bacterium]|nr:MAG: ABC transporter ATP-binding protein [Acidobacteriota bacterium]